MDATTFARFMAKVDRTGDCWLWTASRSSTGYGQFKLDGTMEGTHRLSYRHHHGEIPVDCVVRHMCLNKHCVNPDHLETGTHVENHADKLRDGTDNRGEKHWSASLTADQVIQIRVLAEIGADRRLTTLANMFGVEYKSISKIINRRTWKHIP
jgi:HNH endonuclease